MQTLSNLLVSECLTAWSRRGSLMVKANRFIIISLCAALSLMAWSGALAAPSVPAPARIAPTNAPAARPARTNAAFVRPAPAQPSAVRGAATNALTAPARAAAMKAPGVAVQGTNAVPGTNSPAVTAHGGAAGFFEEIKARWSKLRSDPMSLSIAAVAACVVLLLGWGGVSLLRRRRLAPTGSVGKMPGQKPRKISGCNVLLAAGESRKLWSFDARSHGFALNREYTVGSGEKLPQSVVSRSWKSLFQKKLNVALLPPEHVFLKVVQLPRSSYEELLSMVELQVEKLSPMPLAQVVWGIQVLPRSDGSMDTVVVMIVSRAVVEEFLGQLEGEGYLPDRLEMPLLDQLQATPITEDGAYIYPVSSGGREIALVAWWYGGVLHNLDLAVLPETDRAASLREQLLQMSWAGEIEGWVTSAPRWTLVAPPELAALWEPALREGLEQPVTVLDGLAGVKLATRTAERAAESGEAASLMPPEHVQRYRQQFVDRLWMRGLAAIVVLYVAGVVVYFIALNVASWQTRKVEKSVAQMGGAYTNALELKAQSQVLQDRMELKYAALDCWATVAKLLPDGVVLDSLNFTDGRRLTLMGTAPASQTGDLLTFEAALRKARIGDQPLFGKLDNISYNMSPGSASVVWNIGAELKRTEAQ